MKKYLFLLTLLFSIAAANAQQSFDPVKIDIVRDSFGVPHIFAHTDAEVAYGLAYAHAEDDFKTIQTSFLAGKSMLARYSGKKGAAIDYVCLLLRCHQLAEEKYEADISPAYKKVLEGYCAGINNYAKQHPGEVLVKQLFPMTPVDMLSFSVLQLSISCGADKALQQIFGGTIPLIDEFKPGGSNAYALNSTKTIDGNTYLNINAHQPLEGPVSWYEAHLCSDEGWNIIGALFPCAPSILLGANENLGWAHTVNYPDKLDVYQLEINPANKLQYKFDGEWIDLEENKAALKVKVMLGIKIGAKRKIWWSKYGPAVITKRGTFAIRTGALMDIRGLEQWYWMNKAKNFSQFYNALKMGAIPGYNVMYADRYDTIFYLSNGKIPLRAKGYDWKGTLPGNTSKTLWTQFHPVSDLPQYINPASGYLFNSNHSPFNASAAADNKKEKDYDPTMGYETWENNRSVRFMQLIGRDKISYEQFKRIKYDRQLPQQLHYPGSNADTLFLLNPSQHLELSELISNINSWDRQAQANSKGAAVFVIGYYYIVGQLTKGMLGYNNLTTGKCVEILSFVKNYMLEHFGRADITLGDYQKLVRGDKVIPLPGLPDVIASMESEPWKNGMVKGRQGESYIELVRFTKNGPEIESIHSYGASNKKGKPHFDDQMELFVNQQTKKMTLDKAEIYKKAERIYHPL